MPNKEPVPLEDIAPTIPMHFMELGVNTELRLFLY